MGFSDAPTGQDHLVAGFEIARVGRCHGTREIDPRHVRIIAHQPADAAQDHAVLVVQRRIGNGDRDVAFRQIAFVEPTDGGGDFIVDLIENEGVKTGIGHGVFPVAWGGPTNR